MRIAEADRAVLAEEARALASRLAPTGDGVYEELADLAEAGEVPEDWAAEVETVVTLALETGRARSVHGPGGVRALVSIWKETPRGQAVAAELDDLNTALTGLRGLRLDAVRVSAPAPGTYSISISAGEVEMTLAVDRSGVRLRSLNVGGGGPGE